jgi:hypothetical protein
MLARPRSVRSSVSGATSETLPDDVPPIPTEVAAAASNPRAHGLLVALVNATDTPSARLPMPSWPLWLVPRVGRRGNRTASRNSAFTARE